MHRQRSNKLVMNDEEPSEGRGWRAQQPAFTAVEPFVGAASSNTPNPWRPRLSARDGQTSAELEDERWTWKSRFATRDPVLAGQWEDFTKTVLSFSFAELKIPLSVARRQSPLPVREREIGIYYSNFLPFILEEARAILAEGLEKVNSYLHTQSQQHHQRNPNVQYLLEAKPFQLVLQKQAVLPRTPGNPLCLHFKGSIPHGIEHGRSMNALLLKIPARYEFSEQQWLALASENLNSIEIYAKIIISADDYNIFKAQFKKGARWQAHYLGSVISEQRMFDHCLMQVVVLPHITRH